MYELGPSNDFPGLMNRMEQIIGIGRPMELPDLAPNELIVSSVDFGAYELLTVCESIEDMQWLYDEHFGKEFVQGVNWYKLKGTLVIEVVMIGAPDLLESGSWESLTGRFPQSEMDMIEEANVAELAIMLKRADPLVALRILAELVLRNDSRLEELLATQEVNDHWRKYTDDAEADGLDQRYAQRLSAKLLELRIQAMIKSTESQSQSG